MKKSPKEFTFICDEKSREQLEKLGVKIKDYYVTKLDYGDWYEVKNKKIVNEGYMSQKYHFPLINLSDYLEPTEPIKTKYRFKTKEEFEDTCEKNEDGDYDCGEKYFISDMHHLFGQEIDIELNKEFGANWYDKSVNINWGITPEMLVPLEDKPIEVE